MILLHSAKRIWRTPLRVTTVWMDIIKLINYPQVRMWVITNSYLMLYFHTKYEVKVNPKNLLKRMNIKRKQHEGKYTTDRFISIRMPTFYCFMNLCWMISLYALFHEKKLLRNLVCLRINVMHGTGYWWSNCTQVYMNNFFIGISSVKGVFLL